MNRCQKKKLQLEGEGGSHLKRGAFTPKHGDSHLLLILSVRMTGDIFFLASILCIDVG